MPAAAHPKVHKEKRGKRGFSMRETPTFVTMPGLIYRESGLDDAFLCGPVADPTAELAEDLRRSGLSMTRFLHAQAGGSLGQRRRSDLRAKQVTFSIPAQLGSGEVFGLGLLQVRGSAEDAEVILRFKSPLSSKSRRMWLWQKAVNVIRFAHPDLLHDLLWRFRHASWSL